MDALFYETDFCTLLLPTCVMVYVGQLCVKNSPQAETWGKRIASFAFLLILGMELLEGGFSDPMTIAGTTFSALMFAGMVLGLSWTLLPLPLYLFQKTIGGGFDCFTQWQRKRKQQRDVKREEKERLKQERIKDEEWKRNAPERERQQQEREQIASNKANDQRRREEVRLRCQLLYDQHALELRESFPLQRLESYFSQYLSDQHSAEMVEQRGVLLQEMIGQSLGTDLSGQSEFNSIQEIAIYFREQRTEVESLEYDIITRQAIQAAISTQEDELIRTFMSRKR